MKNGRNRWFFFNLRSSAAIGCLFRYFKSARIKTSPCEANLTRTPNPSKGCYRFVRGSERTPAGTTIRSETAAWVPLLYYRRGQFFSVAPLSLSRRPHESKPSGPSLRISGWFPVRNRKFFSRSRASFQVWICTNFFSALTFAYVTGDDGMFYLMILCLCVC